MVEVTNGTNVYTARDEHAGKFGRIVLDTDTRVISHIVVREDVFFSEDTLVPIAYR